MNKKIVIITGATSGIGKACAYKFAENNYSLILIGRRSELLNNLKQELELKYNSDVITLELDIRNSSLVVEKIASLPQNWKKIDVLINNAGLSRGLEPINEGSYSNWDEMIDTNIKGLLWISKEISNLMILNSGGHIVNLGSIAGKETYANGNVYCATKYAVDSLTKAMRVDLLPHRIKVTAINPGAVKTEFSEVRFNGDKERAEKVYQGYDPLKPEDIADIIYFSVSLPYHVNINDLTVMPIAQASSVYWDKK